MVNDENFGHTNPTENAQQITEARPFDWINVSNEFSDEDGQIFIMNVPANHSEGLFIGSAGPFSSKPIESTDAAAAAAAVDKTNELSHSIDESSKSKKIQSRFRRFIRRLFKK